MSNEWIIGTDIGGSHITAGIVDMRAGKVAEHTIVRKRVNSHARADEIITIWCTAVTETATLGGGLVSKVGMAMPGPFDYKNGICLIKGFDKYEHLYGLNIRRSLAQKLDIDSHNIRFRNDAEAFLAGELYSGAAKGLNKVIGITLGTGLGSARSVDGLTEDAELSVAPMHDGMAEDYISTRGLVKAYRAITGFTVKDVKTLAEDYVKDADVRKAFKVFAGDLALFLSMFLEKDQPEALVIGGNISKAWDLFMPDVINTLEPLLKHTKLVQTQLGENAALIGGACCFLSTSENVEKELTIN